MDALAQVLALLAPPACISCRSPVGAGERLCASCTRALPWLRRACPRCALPSHRGRACPASGAAFTRAWAPMAYEGVARDLVAALKFRAALPVANLMAAHMAANLPPALRGPDVAPAEPGTAAGRNGAPLANPGAAPWWRNVAAASPGGAAPWHDAALANPGAAPWHDAAAANLGGATPCDVAALPAIVPVPTVAGRRRRRGFDPAGVLAAALARRLERPLVDCLERRDHAGRQVGTSRRGRRAPGRLEFVARAPPPRVLLVDDVHTTGATLDAAARALLAAGAVSVAALSYARTL